MKNLLIALNTILLVLVIVLFIMVHNIKKSLGQDEGSSTMSLNNKPLRVAYINADSINSHYLLMKDFQNEIQSKQAQMQEEYDMKAKRLQDEYESYMQKKQSGNISEVDAQKAEQDMQAKKNELDGLQQQQQELLKAVQDRNIEIEKMVQKYIASYNKKAHLDYVLTYENAGGNILFANDSLDITKPILNGLNEQYKDSVQKASSAGTKR